MFGYLMTEVAEEQIRQKEENAKLKTDDGSIIIIEDTGPGIDDAGNNDQPHTAIINIRKRLELMCQGTLTIKNRENGNGTIATIFIPEK